MRSPARIFALTTRLPLPATPGSPLCLAHSDDKAFDGLEIALKGGQVGKDDYFIKIQRAPPSSALKRDAAGQTKEMRRERTETDCTSARRATMLIDSLYHEL